MLPVLQNAVYFRLQKKICLFLKWILQGLLLLINLLMSSSHSSEFTRNNNVKGSVGKAVTQSYILHSVLMFGVLPVETRQRRIGVRKMNKRGPNRNVMY